MGLFYVRFMDDWVILAPTRWKLRGAVKAVQELMGELKLEGARSLFVKLGALAK
jgi:hypothetical protein